MVFVFTGFDSSNWNLNTWVTHHITLNITGISYLESHSSSDHFEEEDCKSLVIFFIGDFNIHTPTRTLNLSSILHVYDITISLLSLHQFAIHNNAFFFFNFMIIFILSMIVLLRLSFFPTLLKTVFTPFMLHLLYLISMFFMLFMCHLNFSINILAILIHVCHII